MLDFEPLTVRELVPTKAPELGLTPRTQFFAIQHIQSGHFLPEVFIRYTHSEPSPHAAPRLFLSRKSAICALNQWVRGTCVKHSNGRGEDYEEWLEVTSVPARKKEDLRVVTVSVKIAR